MEITINNMKFEVEENIAKALQSERDVQQAKLDSVTSELESVKAELGSIDINNLVTERVELIEKCKKLDEKVDTKLGNEDMVKSIVAKSVKIDGKSNDYIMARFDMMLESINEKKEAEEVLKNLTKEDSKEEEISLVGKPLI